MVSVWSYLAQPPDRFDPSYGEDDARRAVDASVEALGAEGDGIEIEKLVLCDLPARGLLAAAEGADLLVVGSRGLAASRASCSGR